MDQVYKRHLSSLFDRLLLNLDVDNRACADHDAVMLVNRFASVSEAGSSFSASAEVLVLLLLGLLLLLLLLFSCLKSPLPLILSSCVWS
jgi:hypothetical protein